MTLFLLILMAVPVIFIILLKALKKHIKNDDNVKAILFLKRLLQVFLGFLIVCYLVLLVVDLLSSKDTPNYIIIAGFFKVLINGIFFFSIYQNMVKLINNFMVDIIFEKQNVDCLHHVGMALIDMTFAEIWIGFMLSIIVFMGGYEYKVTIGSSLFFQLIVGIIILIITFIYRKAILIYEENRLTI